GTATERTGAACVRPAEEGEGAVLLSTRIENPRPAPFRMWSVGDARSRTVGPAPSERGTASRSGGERLKGVLAVGPGAEPREPGGLFEGTAFQAVDEDQVFVVPGVEQPGERARRLLVDRRAPDLPFGLAVVTAHLAPQ